MIASFGIVSFHTAGANWSTLMFSDILVEFVDVIDFFFFYLFFLDYCGRV